jgi:hypothetical protein
MALAQDENGNHVPGCGHPVGVHNSRVCLMPGCDCDPGKPPPPEPVSLAAHPAFALGALEALSQVEEEIIGRPGRITRPWLEVLLRTLRRAYGDIRVPGPEEGAGDEPTSPPRSPETGSHPVPGLPGPPV